MVFSKLPKLISIRVASEHPAVDLAAEELTQYLERLTGSYAAVNNGAAESLALGLMADFPEISAPGVADPDLDDAIHIDTTGATGLSRASIRGACCWPCTGI